MIIDSANLKCNSCGLVRNHHIMEYPNGWARYNDDKDFCPDCVYSIGLYPGQHNSGMKLAVEIESLSVRPLR